MPFDYEQDDDRRQIHVRVRGVFRIEQVLEVLTRMRDEGTWGYDLLYDVRLSTGRPDLGGLRSIMETAATPGRDGESRGRLAIVVTDPILYGMMCAYAALGTPGRIEVFRDRRDAEAWLGRPRQAPPAGGALP